MPKKTDLEQALAQVEQALQNAEGEGLQLLLEKHERIRRLLEDTPNKERLLYQDETLAIIISIF